MEHDYEIRISPGNEAQRGARVGNLVVAMRLPEGEPGEVCKAFSEQGFTPPVASPRYPDGLPEIELYEDGVLVGSGHWPNVGNGPDQPR